MTAGAPVRCPRTLHIVESLDKGAVEGWLLRMLKHARRMGLPMDWTFFCVAGTRGAQSESVKGLASDVIASPAPLNDQLAFLKALRAELVRGRYDVLHCHHDLVSGLYLLSAVGLPLRRRIVHVHNADESVLTPNRWKQTVYRTVLRQLCLRLANRIVGISNHTLDTFLAGRRRVPGRDLVHYYGIDAEPERTPKHDRAVFRAQLGLPSDAMLLLFGGRLVPEKNPLFALDVLSELRRREPRAYAVFAGSGSLEQEIAARASERGLDEAVVMLGWRDDLAAIMRCCDWFILPRPEKPMEGFGIAVVEAQLAGLRLLLSRGVPDDPLLSTARFRRLALSDGPAAWSAAALDLMTEPPPSSAEARLALATSEMNMDRALRDLVAIYA